MSDQKRFTDGRVADSGIRRLFSLETRWQAWLDVEAALALSEAELGIIPPDAAAAIARTAQLSQLDLARVEEGIARTSHPLMPIIVELDRVVGQPHGEWVHWGATTQNITQTGDVLVIRRAHVRVLRSMAMMLVVMADLAERTADVVTVGRTHGQHAMPTTFGFKVAVWIDELSRHVTRLREVEPRLFVAMVGGAVGAFASFGVLGPEVQARVARQLGLAPMDVPGRSLQDHLAEYVCVLGMVAASGGRIAREIYTLMKPEFGELAEPIPAGTIGSSTMPHKRNPQLCQDMIAISAEVRALVPLALEAMMGEHEADGAHEAMMYGAVSRAFVLTGDLLPRLHGVVAGLSWYEDRMRANLRMTSGLVMSEAVMLALGTKLGRQRAHDIVYEAAQIAVASEHSFTEVLAADRRVSAHLGRDEINELLEPDTHVGLSAEIARATADRARILAEATVAHCARWEPEVPGR